MKMMLIQLMMATLLFAGATFYPATRMVIDIGFIVFVTAWTMRRLTLPTMHILSMRHKFKMFRPYTILMTAPSFFNMVPFQSFRWLTNQYVMSHLKVASSGMQHPISTRQGAQPKGTAISTAWINVRPEQLQWGKLGSHLDLLRRGVMQRDVSASPLLSIVTGGN